MQDLWSLSVSPWELMLRGSAIYVGLVLVLRFVLRRDVGSMSVADILFIVIIADASQNAMSGNYTSLSDGAVLLATLIGWNLLFDWLSYRWRAFRRLVRPPALPLILEGRWIRRNLKAEWITTDEILSKLHEQGIDDIDEVRRATLEPSGELGVIKKRPREAAPKPQGSRIKGT